MSPSTEERTPAAEAAGAAPALIDAQFRNWYVFFWTATAASCVLILANPHRGMPLAMTACGLLLALAVLYWFTSRPSFGRQKNSPGAWAYVATAAVVFALAIAGNSWANITLFVLTPQLFNLLRQRAAAAVTVGLNVLGVFVRWATGDLPAENFPQTAGLTLLIIAGSVMFSNQNAKAFDEIAEKAELIDELRRTQDRIAVLSEQQGAETERSRIAREMHDTLAQGFTSIITLGHAVDAELDRDPGAARRHVAMMTDTAQENLRESRRIIAALTPVGLDDASLVQAVERVVLRFAAETDVPAEFSVRGSAKMAPPAIEVVALRIAQEALANVRKHAEARRVEVALAYGEEQLTISIADDGRGFEPVVTGAGYGLPGMRSRVSEAGGTVDVDSAPGRGTRIAVVLPLTAGFHDDDGAESTDNTEPAETADSTAQNGATR